ncbi:MAG: EamA family transporter [Burkholderiales bacterium]
MEVSVPVTLAVLGAALLHATWNALVKSSGDKLLDVTGIALGAGFCALLAAPWVAFPARESWSWMAGSAAVHILYFLCIAGAYRWGELSYRYPLMRGGGPMLVALVGALAFGEVLPPMETLGVALICTGILAFAAGRHDRRATLYALANAVVIAAYTLIDAQGARASGAPVGYALWFFVASGLAIGAVVLAMRGQALPAYLRRNWARATLGGGLSAVSYAVALWAMTLAPVALVAVLRETSVVFAAALGALFLKEPFTARRAGATLVVLAGLVALRI